MLCEAIPTPSSPLEQIPEPSQERVVWGSPQNCEEGVLWKVFLFDFREEPGLALRILETPLL